MHTIYIFICNKENALIPFTLNIWTIMPNNIWFWFRVLYYSFPIAQNVRNVLQKSHRKLSPFMQILPQDRGRRRSGGRISLTTSYEYKELRCTYYV